ncbi:MAG: dihydrofolate reductase [Chitinophagales bacterium]|nr:dihydrofolate reductase [Chitinophagales bacterium]
MIISIIAAVSQNNVIGNNNKLPWHLPADMKYFMQTTLGHHILMGRSTFDSLGKALPKRTNVIITRQPDFKAEGCIVCHDIKSAIEFSEKNLETECFIIGGGEIIRQSLVWADKIYLTRIFHNFQGDTFFPILRDDWVITREDPHEADEKNPFPYSFQVLELAKQDNIK